MVEVEVDWRTKILAVITNPSVAYILILLGIYALIFEFTNPGPGPARRGGRDLRAARALCVPPAAGELRRPALILLGIAFMVAEAFLPAFGSLGIGGLIAFVLGSIILIDDRPRAARLRHSRTP